VSEKAGGVELPAKLAEVIAPPALIRRVLWLGIGSSGWRGRHGLRSIAVCAAWPLCSPHKPLPEFSRATPKDTAWRPTYLAPTDEAPKTTPPTRRRTMQQSQKQSETRERISLSAMILTIVIANVLVLVYVAPYA
jgi:hypothetical protein